MGVPGFNAERGAVVEKYVFVEVVIDALVEVGEGCRISELLTGWRRRFGGIAHGLNVAPM